MDPLKKARSQGVERPFHILVRMGEEARTEIARELGIHLRPGGDPGAQAWTILNRDLKGLQARTHLIQEKLSPFARNNNWWEILTRAARWLRVPFYPGVSEKEVERLIFESVADRVVGALREDELPELDARTEQDPVLYDSLVAAGLSRNGVRLIFLGRGEKRDSTAPPALFPSVSRGLAVLLQWMRPIVVEWFRLEPARRIFKPREWRLASILAALYLQDFVEESVEEFEFFRT